MPTEPADTLLDTRGEKCPLPVLRMQKRLDGLPPGARLTLLATDPMAKIDVQLHCRQHGHACTLASEGDVLVFTILKAPD